MTATRRPHFKKSYLGFQKLVSSKVSDFFLSRNPMRNTPLHLVFEPQVAPTISFEVNKSYQRLVIIF